MKYFLFLFLFLLVLLCAMTACDSHPHDRAEHSHESEKEIKNDSGDTHHDQHKHSDDGHEHNDHAEHEQHSNTTTSIDSDIAERSGIHTATAHSGELVIKLPVRGKILPAEDRVSHIIPRFAGVVLEGKKHIGDHVEAGELMARVESNESLQPFEVRSRINGTVINGHLIVGEYVPANQWVYIVANLEEVWADFYVPLREQARVHVGQKVSISSPTGEMETQAVLSYIAPYADEKSQTRLIRAVVPNAEQKLLPGMYVNGDIFVEKKQAQVVVKKNAVVDLRGDRVVFLRDKNTFTAQPVETGLYDDTFIEILSGLKGGEEYVSKNAFLIKADLMKSGASHDH